MSTATPPAALQLCPNPTPHRAETPQDHPTSFPAPGSKAAGGTTPPGAAELRVHVAVRAAAAECSLLSVPGGRGANGAQSWHLAAGRGSHEVIRAGDKLCVHGHGSDRHPEPELLVLLLHSQHQKASLFPPNPHGTQGWDGVGTIFLPGLRAPVPIGTAWPGLCCLSVLFCSSEGLNCRALQIFVGF